jgi:hypothetical protein
MVEVDAEIVEKAHWLSETKVQDTAHRQLIFSLGIYDPPKISRSGLKIERGTFEKFFSPVQSS